MSKKTKKDQIQKQLEKMLKKGEFGKIFEAIANMDLGETMTANSEELNNAAKKKEKPTAPEEDVTMRIGDMALVRTASMANAKADFEKIVKEGKREERKEEARKKKCMRIAEKQRDKILENNPELEEGDIDLQEMADDLYEELYGESDKKDKKSA